MSIPTPLPWVKLYTDDDVDWLGVPLEARAVFYELLKLGARAWPRGTVKGQDAGIAARIGCPVNVFSSAIELLSASPYKSLRRVVGGLKITNWHKYQTPRDSLSAAQRGNGGRMVDRHRSDGVKDDEREIRGRGRREPWLVSALTELAGIDGYPFDDPRDAEHLAKLAADYPRVDPLEAVRAWATYKIDKPLRVSDNPRSQLRTWFAKSIEFGRSLKAEDAPRGETVEQMRARLSVVS